MPIRRIEGATPAPIIDVNGYPVKLWNRGTIADGDALTVSTIKPICDAISGGYDDLSAAISAEHERAIQAETDLSGWCDSLSSKLDTVSSNLDIVSGDLIEESNHRATKDEELQSQIDTLKAATDVIMVYGTYADFTANSASPSLGLTDADVIKVLYDETSDSEQVYYQWYDPASGHEWSGWSGIGSLAPYYSKSEINNNFLSAKGAVLSGKNIVITENSNYHKITIATKDNVEFTNVSSTTFSGINIYGSTKNTTIDGLINSAIGGSAAYNLLTGQSATLYPGPGIQFYSAAENKLGIKVSAEGIGGTITSIAGSALSAGANYNDGRCIEIGSDNSINLSSYLDVRSIVLSGDSIDQGEKSLKIDYRFISGTNNSSYPDTFHLATNYLNFQTQVPSLGPCNVWIDGMGFSADGYGVGNVSSTTWGNILAKLENNFVKANGDETITLSTAMPSNTAQMVAGVIYLV